MNALTHETTGIGGLLLAVLLILCLLGWAHAGIL